MKYLVIENRLAGFFSCFNSLTCHLCHMYDENIKEFNIIWQNPLYQTSEYNMFDKYFYTQVWDTGNDFNSYVKNDEVKQNYFESGYFQKMNMVMNYYGCFDNEAFKKANNNSIEKSNSLGIHVRKTDHGMHGQILPNEYYFSQIDKNLNSYNYENIFICTDDFNVITNFKKRYGDRLFYNENIDRVNGNIGVHFAGFINKEKLASDVMIDALSMSKCKKILTTASNVSTYTLVVNPRVERDRIDKHISYH